MKTQKAIDHFGDVRRLAAALGISTAAVYQWGDEVPEARQYQLQILTGGALQVDAA